MTTLWAMHVRKLRIAMVAVALVAVACSETADPAGAAAGVDESTLAIRASQDLGVGRERLLVGLSAPDGSRLGSPDLAVEFDVFPADAVDVVQTVPGTFIWIIPDVTGVYRALVEFDRPGVWFVTTRAEGTTLADFAVQVAEETLTPRPGEPAPPSPSLTSADSPLASISTDPEPDPSFYELSIEEAVSNGRGSVIVFATPAFCQTAACGPMLDDVKQVAPDYPEVDFVHVEIYTGFGEEGFFPDSSHLAPAVLEWQLPSEPWIFTVDASGFVSERFEGVVSPEELRAAIDALA